MVHFRPVIPGGGFYLYQSIYHNLRNNPHVLTQHYYRLETDLGLGYNGEVLF